jgi:hypothetical protein
VLSRHDSTSRVFFFFREKSSARKLGSLAGSQEGGLQT